MYFIMSLGPWQLKVVQGTVMAHSNKKWQPNISSEQPFVRASEVIMGQWLELTSEEKYELMACCRVSSKSREGWNVKRLVERKFTCWFLEPTGAILENCCLSILQTFHCHYPEQLLVDNPVSSITTHFNTIHPVLFSLGLVTCWYNASMYPSVFPSLLVCYPPQVAHSVISQIEWFPLLPLELLSQRCRLVLF